MIKEDLQIILSVIEDIEVIIDSDLDESNVFDKRYCISDGPNALLDILLRKYGMRAPHIDPWGVMTIHGYESYPERLMEVKVVITKLIESANRKK